MAAAKQTLGKKLFAGFAAVLLIAMTAIVPILMDVREVLLAMGGQPGQFDANAPAQPLPAETAQRVAALAAHAYSYGAVGAFLLVVTSLIIAYVITRAVNLPLLTIWTALAASVHELRALGERAKQGESTEAAEKMRTACGNLDAATHRLGSLLGTEDLAQPRQS
jgi:hypothetical protein